MKTRGKPVNTGLGEMLLRALESRRKNSDVSTLRKLVGASSVEKSADVQPVLKHDGTVDELATAMKKARARPAFVVLPGHGLVEITADMWAKVQRYS